MNNKPLIALCVLALPFIGWAEDPPKPEQLERMVHEFVFSSNPGFNPETSFRVRELEIKGLWEELKIQVFYTDLIINGELSEGFVGMYHDGQVKPLVLSLGGSGLMSGMMHDGGFYFTNSWGSGIHRSHVAMLRLVDGKLKRWESGGFRDLDLFVSVDSHGEIHVLSGQFQEFNRWTEGKEFGTVKALSSSELQIVAVTGKVIVPMFPYEATKIEQDSVPNGDQSNPSATNPKSSAILLGVLEEPQCKENAGKAVRVLFAKSDHRWIPLKDETTAQGYIHPKMAWVALLDGRKVGNVATLDPGLSPEYSWTYPRDRLLNLAPGQSLPHFPNKAKKFGGWCEAPHDRPIVLVSSGGITDPDRWKPGKPESIDVAPLLDWFKKQAGIAHICPNNPESLVPFNYSAKDIQVLRVYKDRSGRQLITMRLKPRKDAEECENAFELAWDTQSFLLSKDVVYLGPGLELIDTGDYDNDGHSEALFWFSGEDLDGYVLFSDDFASKAEYLWNYH